MSNRIAAPTAVVFSLLLIGSTYAQGGPPFLTDDPGTPGDGAWEINLAITLERGREGMALFEAPLLDVNYGIGDDLQAKLEIPWLLSFDGSVLGTAGSTALGLKWRFLDDEEDGLDASLYPQLEFETPASRAKRLGLVEERFGLLLPLELQKSFGDFSLNMEVGYTILEEVEDEWIGGAVLGFQVSETLELGVEVHATASADLAESEGVLNFGGRLELDEHLTLLATVGTGLWSTGGDAPDLIGYVGLQMTF